MNAASSPDSCLCGCRADGGSEARQVALAFRRQAFIRRTLNPREALRRRVLAIDGQFARLLAERDQLDVDYAGGEGPLNEPRLNQGGTGNEHPESAGDPNRARAASPA